MTKRCIITCLALLTIANIAKAQKPELGVPVGHSGRIYSITISPDGKYAASSSEDKSIRLWELADGKLLKTWEPYREEVGPAPVFGAAFAAGGKYLLCGAGVTGSSLQSLEIAKLGNDNSRVFVDPSVGLAGLQPGTKAIAVSPDGQTVISLTDKNELKLWNVNSGKLLKVFAKQSEEINSLCFAADGKWIYTGNADGSVQRWDVTKGQADFLFKNVHSAGIKTLCLSKNGQMVLSGSDVGQLKLWRMEENTVQPIFEFKDSYSPENGLTAVFSPNDSLVAYGSSDNSVVLWDITTKLPTDRMPGHEREVSALRFSPDGTKLFSGSFDNALIVWDVAAGKQVLALNGYSKIIKEIFFTGNKKYAVAVSDFSERIAVWDTEGGGVSRVFFDPKRNYIITACVSPKGKYLMASNDDNQLLLWDFETAKELGSFRHTDLVNCLAISPDEKLALSGSDDNAVILWDLETRTPLKTFKEHSERVTSVAFSPDGLMAMSGADDNTVKVYDVAQRKLKANIPGQASRWSPVTFSPDGKTFLSISCESFTIDYWDIAQQKIIKTFDLTTPLDAPNEKMYCGTTSRTAFSPDGSRFLYCSGNDVLLWEFDQQKPIYLRGHKALVKSVSFSPDGKIAISAGYDGSVKIWDGRTGEALCTVFHINKKDWVAITPSGLFDASPAAMKSMYFVVGLETIELEQLKERYYEPDLLPILLGFKKGTLRKVDALGELALFPELTAKIKDDNLVIDLKKRTGGFGKVSVAINGSEVLADACKGAGTCKVDLVDFKEHFFSADSLLAQNTITLRAYNQEGWLKSPELVLYPFAKQSRGDNTTTDSEDLEFSFGPPPDPSFHAVVIGTSDYVGTSLDLGFPDKDARAMANSLKAIAEGTDLFKNRVNIHLLTTDATDAKLQPSKQNIQAVFKEVAKQANAEDVLVIFLAGHGVTTPVAGKEDFYYLTKDLGEMKLEAADIRNNFCIATDTLSAWISTIPAKKRVVIFDACHSGKAAETLTSSRAPQSSQKRELERLKDRNGMFVLAASESNQKSWEDGQLQQGLLTYSLLFGMNSRNGVRSDGAVDVQRLFQFARDYVPQLASGINEDQTPVLTVPDREASSFSIGWMSPSTKIEMGRKTEFITQSMFLNKEGFDDDLLLSVTLDQRLEAGELDGKLGQMVFANTRQMSGACALRGFYSVKDGKVRLEGRVFLPGTGKAKSFLVEGLPASDLEGLVERILSEVNKLMGEGQG